MDVPETSHNDVEWIKLEQVAGPFENGGVVKHEEFLG
jgi:hypothetical protein